MFLTSGIPMFQPAGLTCFPTTLSSKMINTVERVKENRSCISFDLCLLYRKGLINFSLQWTKSINKIIDLNIRQYSTITCGFKQWFMRFCPFPACVLTDQVLKSLTLTQQMQNSMIKEDMNF